MTRGILIAGNESSLLSAAVTEALKRVETCAAALIPNRFPQPAGGGVSPPKTEDGRVSLSWNPASSISARTLILAAENRLEHIDNAVVVCSPPMVFKTAGALTPEEIEILVNDHIKGWFFLIRELVLYFRRTGRGSLSFVAPEPPPGEGGDSLPAAGKTSGFFGKSGNRDSRNRNTPADLLGPPAAASFRALAGGILASAPNEPFGVTGFSAAEAGSEADFAAWFFGKIDEAAVKNSGRWLRYSKFKLFG